MTYFLSGLAGTFVFLLGSLWLTAYFSKDSNIESDFAALLAVWFVAFCALVVYLMGHPVGGTWVFFGAVAGVISFIIYGFYAADGESRPSTSSED